MSKQYTQQEIDVFLAKKMPFEGKSSDEWLTIVSEMLYQLNSQNKQYQRALRLIGNMAMTALDEENPIISQ